MIRLRSMLGRGFSPRWLAALAAVAMLGLSSAAHAAPVQFAGYTQKTSAFPVTFYNTASGGHSAGDVYGTTQVNFTFTNAIAGLNPVLYSGADATLSINITNAATVVVIPGSPTFLYENYGAATITLTSNIAIGSHAAGSNLLTVHIDNVGSILSKQGETSPNYSGSSDQGQTDIQYTSDFVNFANTYKAGFNIGFLLKSGLTKTGNYFSSNTASSGGQFSAEPPPVVPEPTSIALVALGLIGAPVVLRRRRPATV